MLRAMWLPPLLAGMILSGCAEQTRPVEVRLAQNSACQLPSVSWEPQDSPQTITEIRRLAAARAKLCGKGR